MQFQKLVAHSFYYFSILPMWLLLTIHNTWGILNVFFIVWIRPMRGGVMREDHVMAKGLNPETDKPICTENIV